MHYLRHVPHVVCANWPRLVIKINYCLLLVNPIDNTTPRHFCSGDSHEITGEVTEISLDRMGSAGAQKMEIINFSRGKCLYHN